MLNLLYKRIDVALNERAVLLINERPQRYLKPGVHRVLSLFRRVDAEHYRTEMLVADMAPEVLALVPEGELEVVELGELERAVLRRRGRVLRWLGQGQHLVWKVDGVSVERIDASALNAEPLSRELAALAPAEDYSELLVQHSHLLARYVDGALESVLGPGRHAAWTTRHKVRYEVLDMRERLLAVNGQELMTRDRVSLRLTVSASWKIVDVERLAATAREPEQMLYLAVQLAAREAVAVRSLDELLAAREALGAELLPSVRSKAEALGLEVSAVELKDVILPGEMKALLNRVIEAQKEAEANVIQRREETAATRSMANTAKVLADNPLLLRLKELEAYKELAERVGKINLVVGAEGLPKIELQA